MPFLLQDEDLSLPLSELVRHSRGAGIIASEVVALLAMAPFVYIEVCTVIEFGSKRWLNVWNLIDLITYIVQVRIASPSDCLCTSSSSTPFPTSTSPFPFAPCPPPPLSRLPPRLSLPSISVLLI